MCVDLCRLHVCACVGGLVRERGRVWVSVCTCVHTVCTYIHVWMCGDSLLHIMYIHTYVQFFSVACT